MAHSKLMMRILLSSPGDTNKERDAISKIVDEINKANKGTPYGIELFRWETDTDPEIILGNGQKLIDKTFDYEHADMLIGIFFRREGKWTEYEIDKAIKVKRKYGFPQIKLYFKKKDIKNVTDKTLKEFERILELEKKYKSMGITGDLKGGTARIEEELRRHISKAFDSFKNENIKHDIFIPEAKGIFINPYKLFYCRYYEKKMSVKQLAKETGISEQTIRTYERVDSSFNDQIVHASCNYRNLEKIEKALGLTKGELRIGSIEADFEKQYRYYMTNHSINLKAGNDSHSKNTKIIIFDFDGTLVDPHSLKTTWQQLWTSVGYDVSICNDLHSRFDKKEITHKEWCDLTAEYFIKGQMRVDNLKHVAENIKRIPGLHDTIQDLHNSGYKLYIVSGSIKTLIDFVLKEDTEYFEEISANEFIFDKNGLLTQIKGTRFDFEGKATYVNRLCEKLKISPSEVLFIGNSFNDAHVYKSGAHTLCVNPTLTNSHNKTYWHSAIDDMKNLSEIMPYVKKIERNVNKG